MTEPKRDWRKIKYYPVSMEKLERASMREAAYLIAPMNIGEDYEYFDKVKHLLDIPEPCKSLEEISQELDEKFEKLIEPKTPAEEAFKEVYGYYPEVCERSVWVAFQKGYEAAQKDYKVGEYQPAPQEPEELKTLYQMLYDEKWCKSGCDEFCEIVKEWMSQYTHNVMTGEYLKGYEECLTVLEENLK